MKKLSVFLFFITPFTALCQPRLDIGIDSTLQGPIKSITERQYSSDDLEKFRWGYQYNFDRSGDITEEHYYDLNSKQFYLKKKFEHDAAGRELTKSNYDQDGNIYSKDSFVYNSDGILIKKYDISYSGWREPLINLDEYELNESGKVIKHFGTHGNQERTLETINTYDQEEQLIKTVRQSLFDTTIIQYNYDDEGRLIKKEVFNIEKGQMSGPCTDNYTYSGDSLLTIEQGCKGGLVEVKKMDDRGRVIYEAWTYFRKNGNKDYYIVKSTYDDFDLIEREEWEDNRNPGKEVTHFTKLFEYEYDDHGNWIKLTRKRIENDEEEIFMIFERDITYYE